MKGHTRAGGYRTEQHYGSVAGFVQGHFQLFQETYGPQQVDRIFIAKILQRQVPEGLYMYTAREISSAVYLKINGRQGLRLIGDVYFMKMNIFCFFEQPRLTGPYMHGMPLSGKPACAQGPDPRITASKNEGFFHPGFCFTIKNTVVIYLFTGYMHENGLLVIGSGLGALSAAALAARHGIKVCMLEQNWLPGGCTATYPRHHFLFESGATTITGMDEGMPLRELCRTLDLELPLRRIDVPMQVQLEPGTWLTRYQDPEQWICEAERVFGQRGQRAFWTEMLALSSFVWKQSGNYRFFPFSGIQDMLRSIPSFRPSHLWPLRHVFVSVYDALQRHGLHHNEAFVRFVNEQLMISAQSRSSEVNLLFGADALCYTNYSNFYADGGVGRIAEVLADHIRGQGSEIRLREKVLGITKEGSQYRVHTAQEVYHTKLLLSGIPLNNLLAISDESLRKPIKGYVRPSAELWSALQAGIAFRSAKRFHCLHYQFHTPEWEPGWENGSCFLSLSHPDDSLRTSNGIYVASVSMHIRNPEQHIAYDREKIRERILDLLETNGFLRREDVVYMHTSGPASWQKWTGRMYGSVGGYPQQMNRKPWQMKNADWDGQGAFLCGDTVYPGQGIPGVVLGGMLAWERIKKAAF